MVCRAGMPTAVSGDQEHELLMIFWFHFNSLDLKACCQRVGGWSFCFDTATYGVIENKNCHLD